MSTNNSVLSAAILAPDILLPTKGHDMQKWATIACDQFTSNPGYWEKVEKIVTDSQSTYNLMLPEIYLEGGDEDARINKINNTMKEYLEGNVFTEYKDSFIYVERTVPSGVRRGLIAAIDLEQYDYAPGSTTLIRASEATVTSRIPPRVKIRKGAPLEMPHILILINDPDKTVIEPLADICAKKAPVYDFDLMLGGGHVRSFVINNDNEKAAIVDSLVSLKNSDAGENPLLFAVGDGNHSLASAKCHYEDLKKAGLADSDSPARYALVEIENIFDSAIIFEPIHRVLFNVNCDDFIDFCNDMCASANDGNHFDIPYVAGSTNKGVLCLPKSLHTLAVGALQQLMDKYMLSHKDVRIDYIHEAETVESLGSSEGNMGFFLPAMDKYDFFPTIVKNGSLPRKTFSMGESTEKRYYIECRKI